MIRPRMAATFAALACAAGLGCYASTAGDGGETGDAEDEAEGHADGDDGDVRPDTDGAEPCTPDHMCYADFPCARDSVCPGPTLRQVCNDIPCSVVCGTTCCSGGSCNTGVSEECPAGTVCLQHSDSSYGRLTVAACLPPPDASSDGGDAVDYDYWQQPETYSASCYSPY